MTVLDLATGLPIDEPSPAPSLLNSLKELVARIESGELKVEKFYVIADCSGTTHSWDSSITATEAVMLLEREKFHILCVLDGVKL